MYKKNFVGTYFTGASLNRTLFINYDFSGTQFVDADLSYVIMINCIVSNRTSFKGANVTGLMLFKVTNIDTSKRIKKDSLKTQEAKNVDGVITGINDLRNICNAVEMDPRIADHYIEKLTSVRQTAYLQLSLVEMVVLQGVIEEFENYKTRQIEYDEIHIQQPAINQSFKMCALLLTKRNNKEEMSLDILPLEVILQIFHHVFPYPAMEKKHVEFDKALKNLYSEKKNNSPLVDGFKKLFFKLPKMVTSKDLRAAAAKNDVPCMKAIIERGVDINGVGPTYGRTALHEAALHGQIDAVKCLLDKFVAVNVKDNNGNTALNLMFDSNKTTLETKLIMADILLKAGADPKIENNDHVTALIKLENIYKQDVVSNLKNTK